MNTKSIVFGLACLATTLNLVASTALSASAAPPASVPAKAKTAPAKTPVKEKGISGELTQLATSKNQWTGIAVSKKNRVFVCFPRWSDNVPVSVGELLVDGSVSAFPDKRWNSWKTQTITGSDSFVCVQSVYVDKDDYLWILDPAAPKFQGPVANAAKLVKFNLKTNKIDKVFPLSTVAPPKSYLNDVRIDTGKQIAYITDSGLGGIVVLDLKSGKARRVLTTSTALKAENTTITIDGKPVTKKIHSDGIALDSKGDYLYFQALTGRTLYRIATKDLLNDKLTEPNLDTKVEKVAKTCIADGIEFGIDGMLYITSLEDHSIKKLDVNSTDKKLATVIKDSQLVWPDSLAMRNDGFIYVTASQINLMPSPPTPYRIFRFKTDEK